MGLRPRRRIVDRHLKGAVPNKQQLTAPRGSKQCAQKGWERVADRRPKRLPYDCNPIGHPQSGCPCGGRSNVRQDNIAGLNEILHTLPETVLGQ